MFYGQSRCLHILDCYDDDKNKQICSKLRRDLDQYRRQRQQIHQAFLYQYQIPSIFHHRRNPSLKKNEKRAEREKIKFDGGWP